MPAPLLPIDQRTLTRHETADLLRGLSDFIETYPGDNFVVTIDIVPRTAEPTRPKNKRTATKSG
jgi:hypothetical protein